MVCFVLYAAQVALRYGADQVANVYPIVFLANGVAGITGPLLGGLIYDYTGSYVWALGLGILVLAVGFWRTRRCGEIHRRNTAC